MTIEIVQKKDIGEYWILDHNRNQIGQILFSGYFQAFYFYPFVGSFYSSDALITIGKFIKKLNK